MNSSEHQFIGTQNKPIHYFKWEGEEKKAVVQIIHGMGEHAARYKALAESLIPKGYILYANDHRGHGRTAKTIDDIGYFDDGDFWDNTQNDLKQFTALIQNENEGLPFFIIGHSMGSLLAREYISKPINGLKGVVLSGTGGNPGLLGSIGLIISKLLAAIHGRKKRSEFLRNISFGKFNKEFSPMRTKADWLSKDETVVDRYVNDPMCSKTFTSGFWIDLLTGVKRINQKKTIDSTPIDLPIYMFSGDRDPVGDNGKGVTEVFENYKKAGVTDIKCTLYPNGRHEMLNEVNRDEVIGAMLEWFEDRL